MKLKFLAAIGVVVFASTLTGCGQPAGTPSAMDSAQSQVNSILQASALSSNNCANTKNLIDQISADLASASDEKTLIKHLNDASTIWLQESAVELNSGNSNGSRFLSNLADTTARLNDELLTPNSIADPESDKSLLIQQMQALGTFCS